jgi:hypothetical protein
MTPDDIYAGAIARFPADGSAPRFAECWDDLAAYAAWLLAEREKAYPARVDAGRMSQAEAAKAIVACQALAAMFRDAAALTLPQGDYQADRVDMIETLLKPLAVLDRKAADDPRDTATADRRDRLLAMIWWLRRHWNGPLHMVEATLAARATASPRKEAA